MTQAILLEPHADDAVLFASFLCIKHRPLVITVLRSDRQGNQDVRERENRQALEILGCDSLPWPFPDSQPDWSEIKWTLEHIPQKPDIVLAPLPRFEENGHTPERTNDKFGVLQHDMLGMIAADVFGDRCRHYLTYTRWHGKDTDGVPVPYEPEWVLLKLRALACFESQMTDGTLNTVEHFLRDHHEYVAT